MAAALVVVASMLAPAAAQAGNPITKIAAGPIGQDTHCDPNIKPDQYVTTAGARVDYCMAYYQQSGDPGTGDDVNQTIADNPEGFAATADTSPQCTLAQYAPDRGDAARCPAGSQTGSGEAIVRVQLNLAGFPAVINQTVPVKMWNLEHAKDAVAGVGLELAPTLDGIDLPHTKIVAYTRLRPNPNVGLRTVIEGMPRTTDLGALGKAPIALDGFFLRFWGSKTDHPTLPQSFSLLGTDCSKDQVTHITTTSYSGDSQSAQSKYRLTDCEHVPFGINASIATTERRPDVPTGVKVTVALDQHSDPRVGSNLGSTTVTLPAGLELGAQVASGDPLDLCTPEQFGWDNAAPVSCPAASKVADIDIVSPLQANPFKGAGYLGAASTPGGLPQMFMVGEFNDTPNAPRVKLRGQLEIDAQNRVTTTIKDIPQMMFERFTLTFRGGDHAPMQTPRQCGTTQGELVAKPSSGTAPVVQSLPLTIDQDCIDPAAFTPTMQISTSNPQAGGRGVTHVQITRQDRQARFSKMVVNLPQGILADLKLATECSADDAAAGSCPASSRVGTVTAESGVGPAPYPVKGDVYLRARDEGAVAGLVISAPVQFGPVVLGRLTMPARIELRQDDLSLRLITEVPQRFKGLPLNLRSVTVDLDREGFGINPTNCSPLSAVSSFTSDAGAVVPVTSAFQVTGCDKLAFNPTVAFKLSGSMGDGDKPSIDVTVNVPPGGSNIKSTAVLLPDGLAADLKQVPRACKQADWDAGTCPVAAQIGTVEGRLAITDEVLTGTLSMVKVDGRTLPSIGMQFTGRFAARLLGGIAVDKPTGQLMTSFDNVPDDPITQLSLHIAGGPSSALFSTAALCEKTPTMVGSFVGQSGATASSIATATCSGTLVEGTALLAPSGSLREGWKLKVSAPTGKKISVLRLSLPAGVSVPPAKRSASGAIKGAKGLRLVARTLQVTVPAGGASVVTATIPKGVLVLTKAAAKKSSHPMKARIGYAGGTRDVLTAKAKP